MRNCLQQWFIPSLQHFREEPIICTSFPWLQLLDFLARAVVVIGPRRPFVITIWNFAKGCCIIQTFIKGREYLCYAISACVPVAICALHRRNTCSLNWFAEYACQIILPPPLLQDHLKSLLTFSTPSISKQFLKLLGHISAFHS